MLITPKGLFKFDKVTKEMYLDALFPGVSLESVRADVPWDLKVADPLHAFPTPDDEEIIFLRRFCPEKSFPNSVALELATAHFQKAGR